MYLYHMPSHPIIMKLSSFYRVIYLIYGILINNCSDADFLESDFNLKSPKALETFKPLLIRPFVTLPPAFNILFFSEVLVGLWSWVRANT